MKEFIDKLIERLREESYFVRQRGRSESETVVEINDAISIANELAEENNMGEISDGYHTFNELYHHRAVLFSVICNSNKKKAWKSKQHDTGDMYEGMFIVGIETPEGQATYHYDINPYWDVFKVKELPKAPKWDGHTPNEAIRRIGLLAEESTISKMGTVGWISCSERLPKDESMYLVTVEYSSGKIEVNFGWFDRFGYIWYVGKNEFGTGNVHAWQPLPAPYKKAGD